MNIFSINYKATAISAAGCVLIAVLSVVILLITGKEYIDGVEKQDVNEIYQQIELILNHEQENLKRTNLDWAHWNDAYDYMNGKNAEAFEEANIQTTTLRRLNMHFVAFVDKNGNVRKQFSDRLTHANETLLEKKLISGNQFFQFLGDENDIRSGLVTIGEKSFLVSYSPITTTDEKSPYNGILIMGREINTSLFYYINSVSISKVKIFQNSQGVDESYFEIEKDENEVKTRAC